MRRKRRVIGICTLLFIAATVFIVEKHPDWIYIVKESFSQIGNDVSLTEVDKHLLVKSAEKEDKKITWNNSLCLINSKNLIPKHFKATVANYRGTDIKMDPCMMEAYSKLSKAVYDNSRESLIVRSSYRTAEYQKEVMELEGTKAAGVNASEHQAGLALDVCVKNFGGASFIKTKAGQYVNSNCYKYGFIIRYPFYGESKTGTQFEPWHIRYVGKPHAEIMYRNRWTFEEYIERLQIGKVYQYENWIIYRQSENDKIYLPKEYKSVVVSSDNMGNRVVTVQI